MGDFDDDIDGFDFSLETHIGVNPMLEKNPSDTPQLPGPMGKIDVKPLPDGMQAQLLPVTHTMTPVALIKPMMILGRVAGGADIIVPDDLISRHHAVIAFNGSDFILYDMGSTNGTMVNDSPITKVVLTNGDRIILGDTILLFSKV